jgi:hypothetical protein
MSTSFVIYIINDCPSPYFKNERIHVICGATPTIEFKLASLNGKKGQKDLVKYEISVWPGIPHLSLGASWMVIDSNRLVEVTNLFDNHNIDYSIVSMEKYKDIMNPEPGFQMISELRPEETQGIRTGSHLTEYERLISLKNTRTFLHPPSDTTEGLDLVDLQIQDPLYKVNAVVDVISCRISLVGKPVDMVIRCQLDETECLEVLKAFPQYKRCFQESGDLVMICL